MKNAIAGLILLVLTSAVFAQGPYDLVRQQRLANGTQTLGYYHQECSTDGVMVYHKSVEKEICLNFSNDIEIDQSTTPWTIRVAGLGAAIAAVAALESQVADLEAAVAALEASFEGKYDIPTGTTADYIRGDGSIAPFPEP